MRKKALCIGIAYVRSPDPDFRLNGAQDDALRLADRLRDSLGYTVEVLLDRESYIDPTKENIKDAIARLVEGAQAGDCLFFHFSGHGDQIPNLDGTEEDGKDEVILPSDWEIDDEHLDAEDRDRFPVEGRILDDELHEWLVEPIPSGCYMNALFDNCHSGTALDLKHRRYCGSPEPDTVDSPMSPIIYEEPDSMGSPTERQAPLIPRSRVGSGRSSRKNSLGIDGAIELSYSGPVVRRNSKRKFSMPFGRLIVRGESKDFNSLCLKSQGNVYSWCACSDEQLAGESDPTVGKASGYMVDAFLSCLDENPTPTYEQLLLALNERLRSICRIYNAQNGRRPSVELIHQTPEFGSNLLPDMTATIVI